MFIKFYCRNEYIKTSTKPTPYIKRFLKVFCTINTNRFVEKWEVTFNNRYHWKWQQKFEKDIFFINFENTNTRTKYKHPAEAVPQRCSERLHKISWKIPPTEFFFAYAHNFAKIERHHRCLHKNIVKCF